VSSKDNKGVAEALKLVREVAEKNYKAAGNSKNASKNTSSGCGLL
jgi:hypothetical protein